MNQYSYEMSKNVFKKEKKTVIYEIYAFEN